MPNIKPISDLRNYTEALHAVSEGAPVFLTKNGRGRYTIVDIQDYERTQAAIRLMNELARGRKSGEQKADIGGYKGNIPVRGKLGKNIIQRSPGGIWTGYGITSRLIFKMFLRRSIL